MTLLSRAKTGASGNEATKSVTNPYWITANKNQYLKGLKKAYNLDLNMIKVTVRQKLDSDPLTHFHILWAQTLIGLQLVI